MLLTRRPDPIPRHKSGKARIDARMREAQSSSLTHRGARVIGTNALRILLISQEPSDGEERNQDNEDNPNIDAHQSSPAPGSYPPIYERQRKSPGACRALRRPIEGSLAVARRFDTVRKHESGKRRIATGNSARPISHRWRDHFRAPPRLTPGISSDRPQINRSQQSSDK